MVSLVSVSVSSRDLSAVLLEKAQRLALRTGLPFCLVENCTSRYLLLQTAIRLELAVNPSLTGNPRLTPLAVDFLSGAAAFRHARNCTVNQPLARAVGIKSGFRPDIVDATAGLGGDSFVLACLGCKVKMFERSPVLAALLADGLSRAEADARTAEVVGSRLTLIDGDAITALQRLDHRPYTIYLDPMYPHSAKSALNKKEMRIIREIVGDDPDGGDLLQAARASATNRVVVKRPKGAEHLAHCPPTHAISMKNSRFDVYLTNHL